MKKFFRNDALVGMLVACAAFGLYLSTMAPSLGFIDSGELATVAATFGIAHPTGYPLFTLVAGAFAKLPLGPTVIWRLNFFAALCCAVSVYFFFRVFLLLLRWPRLERNSKRFQGVEVEDLSRAAAAFGALTLAFSRTFWEQSTNIEVYSLHLLMVSLVLFFFLGALQGIRRDWFLFAFCLGLSFANHMTTVLLLPGLAFLFFLTRGFDAPGWKRSGKEILQGLPVFLAGLSLYLWLPLRAATGPALNWGNPVTWGNFLRHATGQQYSVWMFVSFDSALGELKNFLAEFPGIFGWIALLPMAVGLILLMRKAPRMFGFTALLFLGCVVYAINYTIDDISNYFLLAHVAAAIWVAVGLYAIATRFQTRTTRTAVLAVAGLACAASPLLIHYREVDESRTYIVEDYARNLLASMEPGATILTYQWDNFVSAAYYLQMVEGFRTDVTVLDRQLLQRRWYINQLERNHPEVIAASRAEVDAFMSAARPFEAGEAYDGLALQAIFEKMVISMRTHAAERGPVYFTPEIEKEYLSGVLAVPSGLAFRVITDSAHAPVIPQQEFFLRPILKTGRLADAVRTSYAAAYVNQAYQQAIHGNLAAMEPLVLKALVMMPGYPPAVDLLQRLQSLQPTGDSGR